MAYAIKNPRAHVVHVDGVPINPGQQMVIRNMTGPIQKALDVGDVILCDGTEAREEPRKNAKALKTVSVGDKAV